MATLRISRAHQLEGAELRRRIDALADRLVARFGGECHRQGDVLHYRRPGGVDAEIRCADTRLLVEVRLGVLANFLRGTIEQELHAALDRHLSA